MEKDVALGSVGALKFTLSGGKANVELNAKEAVLNGAVSVQASIVGSVDANVFIDMLFAEIESKSPAGATPIEETVKAIVKQAVAAIQ